MNLFMTCMNRCNNYINQKVCQSTVQMIMWERFSIYISSNILGRFSKTFWNLPKFSQQSLQHCWDLPLMLHYKAWLMISDFFFSWWISGHLGKANSPNCWHKGENTPLSKLSPQCAVHYDFSLFELWHLFLSLTKQAQTIDKHYKDKGVHMLLATYCNASHHLSNDVHTSCIRRTVA